MSERITATEIRERWAVYGRKMAKLDEALLAPIIKRVSEILKKYEDEKCTKCKGPYGHCSCC